MKQKFKAFASIMLLLTMGIGQVWGETAVDATLGTRDSISADGQTRGWDLYPASISASTNTTTSGETHNDIFMKASSSGKQKFVYDSSLARNKMGLSSNAGSDIYIPVPVGSAGTISMSVYSNADTRYLQLYKTKDNTIGTDGQRLYSKLNAGGITDDGKKGPQSFTFTAGDTTMIDGKAYLHFKDNSTEMKISGFSVVLTTGTYAEAGSGEESGGDPAPTTYYTVTLNPAGGTISDATGWTLKGGNYEKEVASGTELTLPTFTKANRTFKTWRNAVPSDVTSPITVSADVTLTAVWCATIENVIYSWEGAEGGATEVGGTAKSSTDGGSSFNDAQINVLNSGYYCIQLNGKNDYSTNIVEITMSGSEKVKAGDYVRYTGFYYNTDTKNAAPKMRDKDGTAIFSGSNLPNITSASPRTDTHVVPEGINSSKVQLTRAQTQTSSFLAKLQIIRPTLIEESNVCAVTFNMHGHGDAVAQQDIVKGGKVTEPATTSISGWVFGGWYKESTFDNTWDFANDVVNADTELHAKWTATASDDATLSDLKVGGTTIAGFDASTTEYYYEMPYGTAKADLPLVTVTVHEEHATATIQNAKDRPDDTRATIAVTAEDDTTVKYYYVYFYNAPKLGVELIKATHKNATEATITGYIGGTADKNTQGGGKLGSDGHYFGIQLASGKFQSGDLLVIKASALNGGNTATLFTDKGETALTSGDFDVASKMFTYTLTKEVSKIYLYRTSSSCNPNVEYIAVYRSMDPFITSFKFGDDAATINESAKTITIELPYSTDVTALTPTLEVNGNGGATYTPTGAQNFSSPVNYVVTDAYDELSTTYAVTVNLATPSENAYLASLSVAGYTLSFDKETTTYNIVLDYGTTTLPEITYEVEDTGLAEAVKVEGGVNGATTITVTPEAGTGHEKVYTINFSVNTSPKFVIYDGSIMSDYADSGSDDGSGFAWTVTGGNHTAKSVNTTLNGKTYTKGQNIFGSATKVNTRYITITIPDGYLAKFYLAGATNSNDDMRSSYISREITGTLDESIVYVSSDQYAGTFMQSRLQLPGTYYYCADNSIRLYELSVQLYPIDHSRNLTSGNYGTICLPNSGLMVGASIYEVAYLDVNDPYEKIFFDEVVSGEMVAGRPYIFLPDEGVRTIAVFYTDEANASAGSYRGLHGFIGETPEDDHTVPAGEYNYLIYGNQYHYIPSGADARILSNRAYLQIGGDGGVPTNAVAPAPGRRRMSMGNGSAPTVPTSVDNAQTDNILCSKVLIDGRLFIIRGEKIYDATGRLVK